MRLYIGGNFPFTTRVNPNFSTTTGFSTCTISHHYQLPIVGRNLPNRLGWKCNNALRVRSPKLAYRFALPLPKSSKHNISEGCATLRRLQDKSYPSVGSFQTYPNPIVPDGMFTVRETQSSYTVDCKLRDY
jgi:hypothetical protein